ncbi:MAG: class I SAM-dependent methyltransferase [Proteobacteria bacterium]|nr:class I SAM-dependent methyltransferase [Pseudomonadota bacterium]MBQ9243568.1 class I SAM-dependent methyltransferase [Pseudomonadota bacterium]
MGILNKFFNQTRKPEGFLGRLMLHLMNSGHTKLADWGLSQLPKLSPTHIVDLGCGGGRNVAKLLRDYSPAAVDGIDYSPLSVSNATRFNQSAIKAGKCTIAVNNVSELSLKSEQYGLATAFETVYFWPGLENCFAQVLRILQPGGTFLIVNESNGTDKTGKQFEKIIDQMKVYTDEDLKTALSRAGFRNIRITHHPHHPWLAVIAEK